MDLKNGIEPVTALKTRSAELIKRVHETGEPVVITQNGKAAAILQDVESYQRQKESIMMFQFILQGEQDFRQGQTLTDQQSKKHLTSQLKALEQFE